MIQTPFSTWDPKWSPTEHEVFRDFGFAAFTAQMLESFLVTILLVAEDAGKIEIKKPKKKRDLESELFLSEQTLGQLFRILKDGGVDEKLTEMIEDACSRNFKSYAFGLGELRWLFPIFENRSLSGSMDTARMI